MAVARNKRVARVVLIGDSIRMGYQATVARLLGPIADVWSPDENGGNSRNVLEHLDEWAIKRKPDVIHINCGLHDLRREFDAPGNAVPLEEYADNVRTILERLKKKTKATIVWATTTPVNHLRHHATKGFDRFESDVDQYNAAATPTAAALQVGINDLYALVMSHGRDELLLNDGVHYSEQGYELLGTAVAGALRRLLPRADL
jgi:lysophospholipase L1-like esterase